MPDTVSVIFGLLIAAVSWKFFKTQISAKSLNVLGTLLIGVGAAYLAQPIFNVIETTIGGVILFSEVTGSSLFMGFWVALVVLTVFETKGEPRRVPIWAGLSLAVVAMFAVPRIMDFATGKYQDASLRSNVNECAGGMFEESVPRRVTNLCDFPIIVGLCSSSERNPFPCSKTIEIAPMEVAIFDLGGESMSSLPSNPNGSTIVACKIPIRPSRALKVGGKGHRGVCLPKA